MMSGKSAVLVAALCELRAVHNGILLQTICPSRFPADCEEGLLLQTWSLFRWPGRPWESASLWT